MPSLPRFSAGLLHFLVGLCLAVMFSVVSVTQESPKPVEAPGPAVFPSAVPATSEPAATKSEGEINTDVKLGAGDLLEVNVYNVPELQTRSRVGNNGDVYLPLVDYIHLAGLTVEEAQALIEKRLSDGGFVKNPHVTLLLNESSSQGTNVLGEVARPGVYTVRGEPRLVDLISAAGGFTDKAGQTITITHRDPGEKSVTIPRKKNLTEDPANNVAIFPGDTILIHKADVVYVVGDVGRPSGFLMDMENLTVLKVIALAGGTNRTAKLSGAKIIRKGPSGMTETPVELKKMLSAKAPDMPLQAEDILFVPSSASKVVMGRTVEAALQAATAVSIVAIR
jgi:polysaccharide export outer membrane protein